MRFLYIEPVEAWGDKRAQRYEVRVVSLGNRGLREEAVSGPLTLAQIARQRYKWPEPDVTERDIALLSRVMGRLFL